MVMGSLLCVTHSPASGVYGPCSLCWLGESLWREYTGLDDLRCFAMHMQRWCYKGGCHDVFFAKAPCAAAARRSTHL